MACRLVYFGHGNDYSNQKTKAMKKAIFLLLAVVATGFGTAARADVNEKVKKLLSESFRDAKDIQWEDHVAYYEVKFNHADIPTRVIYDTEGNILETYRYYGADQLPPIVVSKLNHRYQDRKVIGVTELSTDSGVSYFISMDDARNCYTVQSDPNGRMEQVKKFRKSE